MKNNPNPPLKPINTDKKSPEDKRLEKFVSEHPELVLNALKKWLKEDKNKL